MTAGTVTDLLRTCHLDGAGASTGDADAFAIPFPEPANSHGRVPRHVLAHTLQVALSVDLLARVPDAAAYAADQVRAGRQIVLDHGAIRTVAWPTDSDVPPGVEQVTRVLEPLGWFHRETYPLSRLRMTGHSFAHEDLPEQLGQWFVSELHPDEFSVEFQHAVERTLGSGADPIDAPSHQLLDELRDEHSLSIPDAELLLPVLMSCFTRLHDPPDVRDYELLLAESAEMAWIATEGTAFNHATDRVTDVEAVAEAERARGRPIKDRIEVSQSGRVRQTAYRAAPVVRTFRSAEGDPIERTVPGSFFEFIDRQPLAGGRELDLAFDTSNAQGIFAMTSAAADLRGPAAADDRVVRRPNTTFKPRRRGLSPAGRPSSERGSNDGGSTIRPPVRLVGRLSRPDLPVVLDIGFGHGESTIEMARGDSDRASSASRCTRRASSTCSTPSRHDPLPHVRVVHGDVLRFLTRVPLGSLDGRPDLLPRPVAEATTSPTVGWFAPTWSRCWSIGSELGGELHLATDIEHYATAMQSRVRRRTTPDRRRDRPTRLAAD